jgi:protein-S-isoprenylcysteine O-methyltransferase Ste14
MSPDIPPSHFLEHRIPPPVVGLAIAVGMWAVSHLDPTFRLPRLALIASIAAITAAGVAIALAGVVAFRRARTTVNPLKPETSAALVSSGVYSFTRNPMYLGMAMVLIAWAVYLSSVWCLAGPVAFAWYITRFQIIPEERVLEKLFGADFSAYKKRVRRWL